MFGFRKISERTSPAAICFSSRSRRHATTMAAATSGTTCPTATACITHHGARAAVTAIQRVMPVLMPDQASAAANTASVNAAQTS